MGNVCSGNQEQEKRRDMEQVNGVAADPKKTQQETNETNHSSKPADTTKKDPEVPDAAPPSQSTGYDFNEPLSSDEDENDDDVVEELPLPSQTYANKKQRQSVSAEAYGAWNQRGQFTPPVHYKTPEQKQRIRMTLAHSFLFNSLEEENLSQVIDAFQDLKVKSGVTIIQQGDDGDRLYLIEHGDVDVFKQMADATEPTWICKMGPGDTFGELALMYNAPRAATVKASTDMQLWGLDRESFNTVVKEAAAQKRNLYESFLKDVSLLKDMCPYERAKVADALKSQQCAPGTAIIQEGDEGDTFYILTEGSAEAVKGDTVVMTYEKGGYFGELALLDNKPRAATVRATGNGCKLVYLDRRSFKRLLGPVQSILMRNKDNYKRVCEQHGLPTAYLD